MELLAPAYYRKFKCIAHRCSHSCCVGWEIDVDADTLARYTALPGHMGDCIRQSIEQGTDGAHFVLGADDRCPHLDAEGLCRIITELGEGYLCDICREHPRFYNPVGDHMECGLGASCEEAARLILAAGDYTALECIGEAADVENRETVCDFDVISQRKTLFSLLSDNTLPYDTRRERVAHRFGVLLLSSEAATELLEGLEYLDERHRALLMQGLDTTTDTSPELAPLCERFLAYLIYRHASAETTAEGFRSAVGLALLLERCFYHLAHRCGLSPVESARITSEELEYSEENTDAIRFALELKML